jgi:hypothetical protein
MDPEPFNIKYTAVLPPCPHKTRSGICTANEDQTNCVVTVVMYKKNSAANITVLSSGSLYHKISVANGLHYIMT